MRDLLLTARQVSERLGVSVATVQNWTHAGILSIKNIVEGKKRYSLQDVEEVFSVHHRDLSTTRTRPPHVLIVDDQPKIRAACRNALHSQELVARESENGLEALVEIACLLPDLVILDLNLSTLPGSFVLGEIRKRWPEIPVLVLTEPVDVQLVQRTLQVSCFHIVKKPVQATDLQQAVAAMLDPELRKPHIPLSENKKMRILVVDDDELDRSNLVDGLSINDGWEVQSAENSYAAGRIMSRFMPDILVVDIFMGGVSGLEICEEVKSSPLSQAVKIMALSNWSDQLLVKKASSYGVDTHLIKPFSMDEVYQGIQSMEKKILKARY